MNFFNFFYSSNLLNIPQSLLDQDKERNYKKFGQIQGGIDRARLLIPILADTILSGNIGRGGNNAEIPISIGNTVTVPHSEYGTPVIEPIYGPPAVIQAVPAVHKIVNGGHSLSGKPKFSLKMLEFNFLFKF